MTIVDITFVALTSENSLRRSQSRSIHHQQAPLEEILMRVKSCRAIGAIAVGGCDGNTGTGAAFGRSDRSLGHRSVVTSRSSAIGTGFHSMHQSARVAEITSCSCRLRRETLTISSRSKWMPWYEGYLERSRPPHFDAGAM